jgi:hypothetical protein
MRTIFLLLILLFSSTLFSQQIGGKLKEVRNQHKLKKTIWGGGLRTRNNQPNYFRRTEPDRTLFFRFRSANGKRYDKLQKKINKKRAKMRLRGRNQFHKRKYT